MKVGGLIVLVAIICAYVYYCCWLLLKVFVDLTSLFYQKSINHITIFLILNMFTIVNFKFPY